MRRDTVRFVCDGCGVEVVYDKDNSDVFRSWRSFTTGYVVVYAKIDDAETHSCSAKCRKIIYNKLAGIHFDGAQLQAEADLAHPDRAKQCAELQAEVQRLRAEVAKARADVDAARTANVQLYYSEVRDAVILGVHTAVGEVMKAVQFRLPRRMQ